MPFCTHCGTQVMDTAAFCAQCGQAQPGGKRAPVAGEISPETASTFCYTPFVGWIGALIVLSSETYKNNARVRFHAFQGLYIAVFWLLIDVALLPIFGIAGGIARRALGTSLRLATLAGMCFLMYKTARGEDVDVPFVGELAQKSAAEQGFRV